MPATPVTTRRQPWVSSVEQNGNVGDGSRSVHLSFGQTHTADSAGLPSASSVGGGAHCWQQQQPLAGNRSESGGAVRFGESVEAEGMDCDQHWSGEGASARHCGRGDAAATTVVPTVGVCGEGGGRDDEGGQRVTRSGRAGRSKCRRNGGFS